MISNDINPKAKLNLLQVDQSLAISTMEERTRADDNTLVSLNDCWPRQVFDSWMHACTLDGS